ncbi:FHA domain-containing protein [Arthrobacter sp. JZ12]|uniref:FHA domain-containing protein n=1 Tax=Arthrobacter sp. JZ12 TaxID=2654190 RepID=UPI002B4896A9|nr:FHA domain-containing protein [Arthrobacter sp. JZ12]WRH24519.1 FHA domain-containing protein [Arthrobacter sp. JZ12]
MNAVRYQPGGDWLGIVRAGAVVLLPSSTDQGMLDRLWSRLADTVDLQSVLQLVSGGFGQGLASMPPFAVVLFSDRLHAVLRGSVRLTVGEGDDAVELSGEHVTTWTERIFDAGEPNFTLRAGNGYRSSDGGPDSGHLLTLEAGMMQTSLVTAGPAPAPWVAVAPLANEPVVVAGVAETDLHQTDPEKAATGAAEAEELATINPALFLGTDGSHDDPADGTADDAAEDTAVGFTDGTEATVYPSAALAQEEPSQGDDPDLETTGYDHLWDRTVVRRVEDAAVRPADNEDEEPAPEPGGPASRATESPSQDEPSAAHEASAPRVEAQPAVPAPAPTPVPPSAPGLIDSVPWARKSTTPLPPAATADVVPPLSAPVSAVPPAPAPAPIQPLTMPANSLPVNSLPATQAMDSANLDDHDGQTIMRSDLQQAAAAPIPAPADSRPGTGPMVLARLCGQGHANPPEASTCGVCSSPLTNEPQEVRRPSLGTMRISTGEVVELDQPLVIGRQPSVSRVQGKGMPKLIQVTSAGGDISRSHVEVRLDGWHVLLCDLRATNGTVLIRPGQAPRRLGEGESAILLDGDVAQLGDDVFLRFEGLR